MKHLITFFLIVTALLLGSCAHKSGRTPRLPSNNRKSEEVPVKTNTPQAEQEGSRQVEVTLSNLSGEKNKLDGPKIFSKYNSAVFMVFTSDGYSGYQGSGFFINSEGLAVSNYHVFRGTHKGAELIKLANSEEAYKVVEVIHSDSEEDFILFRVNVSNTNFIPVAKDKPKVGEKVYAIGSPRGLENTFSSGEVSQWRDKNLMQISALIDHGSSGGALINEFGEVVGITSGSFADGSQANLNYAWSIDAIKPYINYR
ncbi:MAG: serine protease [Muribaculaceae bacterium]|nr:serine protease [Muribaculaceae bacterium]MDE5976520.1 serine protease [Muribaculaceae bacterium]